MDKRLITQKQKIIAALKEAGEDGLTNVELSKISLRYGGHLGDLYRKGYKIKKYNLDGGLYKYQFISEPADIKYFPKALDEILDDVETKFNDAISKHDLKNLLQEKRFTITRMGGWYQDLY